jgi:hypothetical protein
MYSSDAGGWSTEEAAWAGYVRNKHAMLPIFEGLWGGSAMGAAPPPPPPPSAQPRGRKWPGAHLPAYKLTISASHGMRSLSAETGRLAAPVPPRCRRRARSMPRATGHELARFKAWESGCVERLCFPALQPPPPPPNLPPSPPSPFTRPSSSSSSSSPT